MFVRIVLRILVGLIIVLAIGLGFAAYVSRDLSPAYLEEIYTDDTSRFVEVGGVRFHVRETGTQQAETPSLVMIHGFGAHLQTWDAWVQDLDDQFHIIRFDLPGHGLTGPDPTGNYSNDRTVGLVDDLLDMLGVERRVMIGNSLGGLVAWRHSVENTGQVAGQILLAPAGMPFETQEDIEAHAVPGWFDLINYIFPKALVKAILEQLYADPSRVDPETVTRYHELIRREGNRPALLARMRVFGLEDPEDLLRSLQTPTLILWGREDTMIPVEQAGVFDQLLPNATTLRLPGVGHMPMEEVPAETVPAVRTFLRSLQ